MIIKLEHHGQHYSCDLSDPLDLSIPVGDVKCFHAPDYHTEPYTAGDFIGSVTAGAPVNFYNVAFNPHGQGTHTECLGHITAEQESVNDKLLDYHSIAQLISLEPEIFSEDSVITQQVLERACSEDVDALIIRTLPNSTSKLTNDYSDTNPAYIAREAMQYLVDHGVKHLLIDLPSVDRERDEGKLAGHHIFWGLDSESSESREHCTITELIYVPNEIEDGLYFLNLQVAPFRLDASPSKPVIYVLNPQAD